MNRHREREEGAALLASRRVSQSTADARRSSVTDLWTTRPRLVDFRSGLRDESNDSELDEDGAALIEFAILAPLLLMLLFGIVSAGLAYNNSLALTHAAREAGRQAATLPVSNFADLDGWLAAVSAQVIGDAAGSLDPGVPGRYVCVAYVHPDGTLVATDQTRRLITSTSGPQPTEPLQQCFTDNRPSDERRIQIAVAREAELNVILFSTTVTLDSEAVSRFEAGLGG